MADTNILSDFGINILEEEIDDVIFQTNEFLCDATTSSFVMLRLLAHKGRFGGYCRCVWLWQLSSPSL